MAKIAKLSFQEIILKLLNFWTEQGCVMLQPYDTEMGAGTLHPATCLRALGPDDEWNAVYLQPSRRPTDGRYAENPNRLQHYYQLQVIMKPSPENFQELYLQSLKTIGLDASKHDIRFAEDDWENPSIGAWGLGWEVWCDGMEISQFTYMQQIGGHALNPIAGEITYGLERISMYIQDKENVYDLEWNKADGGAKKTYGDVYKRSEREGCFYVLDYANTEIVRQNFENAETECINMLEKKLAIPAYEQCIKASHFFNILDARGVISVTDRAGYIAKIRNLAKECCTIWLEQAK